MVCRIGTFSSVLTVAFVTVSSACCAETRHEGVRLTTSWSQPILNQGDTIVNTLDVSNAVAGQKIRIQNSNHGASSFTASFGSAIEAAVANIPGIVLTQINPQQIEITLTAGSYAIPIAQTVTKQTIQSNIDDAPWAPGMQLQTDWLLSSAPINGAPIEAGFATNSRWITYLQQGSTSAPPQGAFQSRPSDARWSLLRSIPYIGAGESVTFEIGETNYTLTAETKLKLSVDSASTAHDGDFVHALNEAVTAALKIGVTFDPKSEILTFGPETKFPFAFNLTAKSAGDTDYILAISNNEVGEIDVAKAGVRLGTLSVQPTRPVLGINEASGEFGIGKYSFKYMYPGKDRFKWAEEQGFGIVRVPFLFQNLQTSSGASLNDEAMREFDSVLNECEVRRIVCLIDMHNYGSYYRDSTIGEGLSGTIGVSNSRLADVWAKIANRYKNNAFVWFGIMNEPNKQSPLEWIKTSNSVAAAIRSTGATNKILFPGTAWTGAWTWANSDNAVQMLKAYDSANNYAFEAHQYLDRDGSGTSASCVAGSGATRLVPFTMWLQKYGLQGIIGEVGWAANEGCAVEGAALLEHWRSATTSSSGGGYIGLTYWAAGPWWPDNYMYLAEPRPFPTGPQPEQLGTLRRYLPH